MVTANHFTQPISEQVWAMKYQMKDYDGTIHDYDVTDTWRRIAQSLASVEKKPEEWEDKFYDALDDFKFLPAGRITAGAGTDRNVTLVNCFVTDTIKDSMNDIFAKLKESALTMQQGGGIGMDFSTLRPKGAEVKGVSADASGPLSFMDCWDSMCRTVMSAGSRRGAMMATMRCDHPDVEDFIVAKQDKQRFRMFNMSVMITDPFMEAVKNKADWDLVFTDRHGETKVYKTVKATDLWDKIMRSTFEYAEPGVLFIDRINQLNNLNYCETICATNPCGEQPLPPYGACVLGSINLTKFVKNPFTVDAYVDYEDLREIVSIAIRMLDNVNDVTRFPLEEQRQSAQNKRRIGLGITGLADMLLMMGYKYGSEESLIFVDGLMQRFADYSYMTSSGLALEKGLFPYFDAEHYEPKVKLSEYVRDSVRLYGMRNSHVLSIAPTGTISLYANNISSGIEPVFAMGYDRKILMPDGSHTVETVKDYAVALWGDKPYPDYFVTAQTLKPIDHVRMQATVQKYVDTSISKTVNCPADISFEDFKEIYMTAWESGCKGCTTYRPNDVTGSILSVADDSTGVDETKPVDEVADGAACSYDATTGRYTCDQ